MSNITLFERERRAQAHREELAMLEAERAAVDRLAKSYELMAFALLAIIDAREKLSGPSVRLFPWEETAVPGGPGGNQIGG